VGVIERHATRDAAARRLRSSKASAVPGRCGPELKLRFRLRPRPSVGGRRSDGQSTRLRTGCRVAGSDVHQYGRDLTTYCDFPGSATSGLVRARPASIHHQVPRPRRARVAGTDRGPSGRNGSPEHDLEREAEEVTARCDASKALTTRRRAASSRRLGAYHVIARDRSAGSLNGTPVLCGCVMSTMTLAARLRAGSTTAQAWAEWLLARDARVTGRTCRSCTGDG